MTGQLSHLMTAMRIKCILYIYIYKTKTLKGIVTTNMARWHPDFHRNISQQKQVARYRIFNTSLILPVSDLKEGIQTCFKSVG